MSRYRTFEELKNKSKEFVQSSKERGAFNGLRKLLTELYPDRAHFIYELLQNAEDKCATTVYFDLYDDKLVFTHDGSKRDFILDDIDSITNIGESTKIDDPTSIGKFGVGFKAVYSYTNTPEIHSGDFDFKIVDLLVPEDEGVKKTAEHGKTQFVFPFDHDKKMPSQAVSEITDGLIALDENSILFLKNIHKIIFRLTSGEIGRIIFEDKDEILKKIVREDVVTKKTTESYWYKFTKPCVVGCEKDEKNCNVDIAYKLKKIEGESETKYKLDANLKGNVCIFFPAIKENSHFRFHINAPFASTVARDSVRDCDENRLLVKELSILCVESLYKLKEKGCLDANIFEVMPNHVDFKIPTYLFEYNNYLSRPSFFEPIYQAIHNEFKAKELILTISGEYKKVDDVFQTDSEIIKVITPLDLKKVYKKYWIQSVVSGSNSSYFLSDIGVVKFDRKSIVDNMRQDPKFFDVLFFDKTAAWFRNWYSLLFETQSVGIYKEVFKKVKMVLGCDGQLHYPNENIYIKNPLYRPETIKNPLYVDLPNEHAIVDENAKRFLEMIDVKVMSAEVDVMANIHEKTKITKDDVLYTLMMVIAMNERDADISGFVDKPIFIAHEYITGESYRIQASKCCISEDVYFFYSNDPTIKCVLYKEDYAIFGTEKEKKEFSEVFKKLGGKIGPEIKSCQLTADHPMYNQLNTSNERSISCIKKDYSLTGVALLKRISEDKLYSVSRVLWDYIVEDKNYKHHIAEYRANARREIEEIDSTVAYYLKRIAWIPNKNGEFCRPCDVSANDLYDGFVYNKNAVFLNNLGFGNKTKAPNDIISILKKAGFKMSQCDEYILNASEADKREFIKYVEAKQSKRGDVLSFSDAINAENKDQSAYEDEDDYGRNISITNVNKRQQKQQQDFEEGLTVAPSRKQVWHYTYLSTSGKLEKQFISEQYHGKCQICGRPAIRKFNGQPYFEAINVINTANLDPKYQSSLDAGWNTLCLCPNCAAEYRYCAKDLSDLETQVENTQIENRKNEYIEIYITLKGVRTKIMFTPRHFLALQTAFKAFKNHNTN